MIGSGQEQPRSELDPPNFHKIQFYDEDDFIVSSIADFAATGLDDGNAVVVIATSEHLAGVNKRLANRAAVGEIGRRYIALDATQTLARLTRKGAIVRAHFDAVVGALVERLAKEHGRVRAFGEMVALLWVDGHRDAALELEHLWNELGAKIPLDLLCAYPIARFTDETDGDLFLRVCSSHSHVQPTEAYSSLTNSSDRLNAIADLQRKANRLDSEIASRSAAQEALARSERELADFFDNGPVPLHWVGPDGIIVRANRAELAMLGYPAEEYIGHHISNFYVRADVAADVLQRLTRGESLKDHEVQLRCKDGSIRTVLLDSNVYSENGVFAHTRCVTRDVTDARRAEEASARLATIIECSDDAIISKTLDGVITSWNRGAERIFGYTAAEMVGARITQLLPPDRTDDFPRIIATLRRGERVDHFETERITKDGRRIHVSVTVSPLRNRDGRVIGASKIARDITERRHAEAARAKLLESERQAVAEAEAAMRAKDEFLSVVSHELRTPLASILGWVNVLKSGATGDKAVRALETIERSGRAQAKLIEDLLDVSRIITGKMRLDFRLVELPAVLRQAVDTIRPTAEAKSIRIEVDIDESAGPVAGDVDRLQQVAWNLLSNAVKFTPAGGHVRLRLLRRDQDVCLSVEDSGRGIDRDFLPFIFERFRQADRADSRRSGGLGLGLSIVRHLVELHGGTVAVASEGQGQGATFHITLPLASSAIEIGEPTEARPLSGLRILAVDDNFDAQDGLRMILDDNGARVTVAGSAEEANDLLNQSPPDVVISDIRLPGTDGFALARTLRQSPQFQQIPAIALTGLDPDEQLELATAAGFDAVLAKPASADTLVRTITDLLRRRRRDLA